MSASAQPHLGAVDGAAVGAEERLQVLGVVRHDLRPRHRRSDKKKKRKKRNKKKGETKRKERKEKQRNEVRSFGESLVCGESGVCRQGT
eukprot:57291-Rhodomonas_salina.1